MLRFLDLETPGLDPFAPNAVILMLGWADGPDGRVRVLHLADHNKLTWKDTLRNSFLTSHPLPMVGHNFKFDLKWLARFGVRGRAAADTMLMAQLVNENRLLGLKPLMAKAMGGDWTWQGEWDASDPVGMARYQAKDVVATRKLYYQQLALLTPPQKRLLKQVVMPALNRLVAVELRGIYMDRAAVLKAQHTVLDSLDTALREVDTFIPDPSVWPEKMEPAWGNTNWQRWLLFTWLGQKPSKVGKPSRLFPDGSPSMDALALLNLGHPLADALQGMAKQRKLLDGFITPYLDQLGTGHTLHTTFNLGGTVTGRLSAGRETSDSIVVSRQKVGINLQQVPKDKVVKPLFSAPPGWVFMEADYSQLELRVIAEVAQEQVMLRLYREGRDIHSWMGERLLHKPASEITELERRSAKAVNFGFAYGMLAKHFSELAKKNYGVDVSSGEAEAFRTAYFDAFPGLAQWHARSIAYARSHGYVQTLFGRRRHLPDIHSTDFMTRLAAERQAINAPIQGTGSDIALTAFVRLGQAGPGWRCLGLVHDALLFYAQEAKAEAFAAEVGHTMVRSPLVKFNCPLAVEVTWGRHWGDHKETREFSSLD